MAKKQRVFLSDNDGTLTVARKPIRGEMAETIVEFARRFKFAIVTGSPWHDMEEQMPPEILTNPNIDYWCNMGNTLYREGKEIYNAHNVIDFEKFRPILADLLKSCPYQFHKSFPRHYEIHANCAINFTMLGRPEVGEPSMEDRNEYASWDAEVGQRLWIIDYLNKLYPEYNMSLGGQISVDIVKKGCDKAQVVGHYKDDYKICYFGDRIYKPGNDNAVAHEVVDAGGTLYSVKNPHETMRIMQKLIELDKEE
jgi:HAD superfamily hydrolase (TIGR01484 family)